VDFDPQELKTIGKLIEKSRGKRTQVWLAGKIGTKASAISSIENGRRSVPKDKVEILAEVLSLKPSALMPTRRLTEEIKGLSFAFRGVQTLPKEALLELADQYLALKKRYADKQNKVKKSSVEAAQDLLKRCGVKKPPVNLYEICERLKVIITPTDKIDFSGYIVQDKKGVCGIGVKENMSQGRKQFTIAHELGHLVLEHLSENKIECTEGGLSKSESEKEADEFASNLLMPEPWVREVVGSGIKGIETLLSISSLFNVSQTAAARRIVELSDGRCAVVMSENGNIKWGIASRRLGGWIKRGAKLSKQSQAFKLLSKPLAARKPIPTKANFWFEGPLSGKFVEHSTQIHADSGSVISLVWEKLTT
jgi:Zn-dependent peptidase ImmA (M78 family)